MAIRFGVMTSDTIFALSTGPLPSGIAVIRVSGPACGTAIEAFGCVLPQPRRASVRKLLAQDRTLLDRALVLFFRGPASATGEDCLELHLHGGRAVVAKALEILSGTPGLRHAEAGDFTRRAFLNGQIDLVEAEGLGDLIRAETEAQRRFAVLNSGTLQSRLYGGWRGRLLHARAMIEAELDFSDESDVPGSVADAVWRDMNDLRHEMETHILGFSRAEMVRDGYRVVLVGPPNAGKSSLLNTLARRDVAIVSPEPGTTRDVIEVNLDLNGFKVVLTDTAGLRDGAEGIELLGMKRTLERARQANLILAVSEWGQEQRPREVLGAARVLPIVTKIDLATGDQRSEGFGVSVVDGSGLEKLLGMIADCAKEDSAAPGEILPARERHVALFTECTRQLGRALEENAPLELRAEALRLANGAVGRVIGAVDAEDVLGAIFSQFCVGK